ncbi:MAG TPA: SusC/RagA family TonB-linked outer membrane protein [Candidatus Coprenecus stercoravium]|uniref:SusC/RagA family TonB-linked outer membrane protein n=1 Tax=Candidatus Coprenecus stercoravium TaxID=2840735 RepID=A0A9D2K9F6_9BACT|nr:SusC/RagA family TonB-linked outer membrane protein [Candidatus Coprenecus stercoravium]
MKKIRLFLTGLLLAVTASVYAQDITVSGTVTDASTGEGIAGATVLLKGNSSVWALTDGMGAYTLSVPSDGVLEVSFLGYTTLEVPVNGRSAIDVELEMSAEMLDDVIVVGYGSARKISSVVGSASTVNKKVIANRPTANAGDALQGQVSGLQVFSSSGEPSASVSMRLRGVSSINADTTPLFILDGSPVSASVFTSLNSNDIENVVVMKDASSTAIYGSRAANGVIYITTKRGASGEKPVVSVRAQYGVSQMARNRMNLMSGEQWFDFQDMIYGDSYEYSDYQYLSQELGINTDWTRHFFDNAAPVWSLDASVSGATAKSDYYISLGVFDQNGIALDSEMTRYNIRTNVNTQVNDWLKMGMNIGMTYQEYSTTPYQGSGNNSFGNVMFASSNLPSWLSPYDLKVDDNTNEAYVDYEGGELDYWDAIQVYNPKYLAEIQPRLYTTVRLNASTYQQITPIKGLTLKAQQSIEGYDTRTSGKVLASDPWPFSSETPQAYESFGRYYALTFTNTAEYRFAVAERNHFAILLGHESIIEDSESFDAGSNGQTDARQPYLGFGLQADIPTWGKSEINYNSAFARLSYDFDERYYIDASWRIDGSSLFGVNKKYANFYSVGFMWDLKRERWMQGASWINDLRFKASYGTTGNSGIDNYLSYAQVGAYAQIYDGGTAWGVASAANPDLTWETVETLNVGLTTRLWNFLGISVEFYNKNTRDMLMSIPYSYTTGYSSGVGNIGDMYNRGVDVDLSFDIINTRDIYFNVKTNFNYNKNEVTALFDGRDSYTLAGTGLRMEVGHSWGEYYLVRSAGVDPRDGMQMWYDKNGNKTKVFSQDDMVMTGKQRYAPWAGGLQLNFQYKGLYIGADFTWVANNYLINNDRWFLTNPTEFPFFNMSTDMLNIWREPGQVTDIPSINSTRQIDDDTLLENASFLRLKNLQVSYSLPERWMQKTGFLGGARIYAIARNLFTVTGYTGWDPEVDSNVTLGGYPNTREFSVGVELTF